MIDPKLCTVVIPCFNRIDLLKRCICSFSSCFSYVDILVVDDGSCPPISLAEFADDCPVRILRLEKNLGRFCALKAGSYHVVTEYLLVFDSDDTWVGSPRVFSEIQSGFSGWVFLTTATKIKNLPRGEMFSYFAIRYLSGIEGDLKEICRSEKFRSAIESIDSKENSRVPTTLVWLLTYGDHEIFLGDQVVCKKEYLAEGMSSRSFFLRLSNASNMFALYDLLVQMSSTENAKMSTTFAFLIRKKIYYFLAKLYDPHH